MTESPGALPKTPSVDAIFLELLDWWNRARGGGPYPLRSQLEPQDIPHVIPWMVIAEVVDDPADYRFRLCGTAVDEWYGVSFTGRLLSELPVNRQCLVSIQAQYAETTRELRPTVCAHVCEVADTRDIAYRRLLLPASLDGARADLLIGAFVFDHSWPIRRTCYIS